MHVLKTGTYSLPIRLAGRPASRLLRAGDVITDAQLAALPAAARARFEEILAEPAETTALREELAARSVKALHGEARALGLTGYSSLGKAQLVERVLAARLASA